MELLLQVDDWGEVFNSEANYEAIASELLCSGSVILGWTDEESTHFDVFLSYKAKQAGYLQGGLRGGSDLFVGISRLGFFGFSLIREEKLHPNYIAEKLNIGENSVTTQKLGELINGVMEYL